jgi:hypothetical protein
MPNKRVKFSIDTLVNTITTVGKSANRPPVGSLMSTKKNKHSKKSKGGSRRTRKQKGGFSFFGFHVPGTDEAVPSTANPSPAIPSPETDATKERVKVIDEEIKQLDEKIKVLRTEKSKLQPSILGNLVGAGKKRY